MTVTGRLGPGLPNLSTPSYKPADEGANLTNQSYGEDLPEQCPPDDARDEELGVVYRLVPSAVPDEACFASKRALADVPPPSYKGSPCEWASCSLNTSVDALLKIRGLVKRNPFVAKLDIPASSGMHNSHRTHVNFWKYQGYSIASAVTATSEHGK